MQEKILTFIIRDEKMLALYSEPHPEHGKGDWFVVTGGVEDSESHETVVTREVMEETGLVVRETVFLNWSSIYNWEEDICEEYNFISFVDLSDVILNEEHSKYEWLELEDFIERIKWGGDKKLLREVLKKGMNREKYFQKLEIKDYRRKDE